MSRDTTLSDSAYDQIKSDIVSCTLAPGQLVTENELCERYGYGKAPIRNALTRLESINLVRARRRQGYEIAPITLADAQHIFQLRMLIEPELARLAAGNLKDEQLQVMNRACGFNVNNGPESIQDFLQLNEEFHLAIAEAAGNPRFKKLMEQLLDDAHRMLYMGLTEAPKADDFRREHKELLEALMSNRPEKAANLVREQLQGGLDMVAQALLKKLTAEAI